MSERASIFGDEPDDDLDVSDFAPVTAPRPRSAEQVAAVRQTAEARGFLSREAPKPALAAAPARPEPLRQEARLRRRRTGRDKQLNIKTTDACLEQFYALVDANGWGLGEAFERAVAALEAELKAGPRT